jgi:hypothetical protein
MRQLQYRAQTAPKRSGKDRTASPDIRGSTSMSTSNSNSNSSDPKSKNSTPQCIYCKSAWHTDDVCCCKHPEKASKEWLTEYASRVRRVLQSYGDSIPNLPGLEVTSAKATVVGGPISNRLEDWYFDTCAGFHMTSNRELFTTYTHIERVEEIAGSVYGDIHGVVGIGNIDLHHDGLTVTLHNVRHIPGLDSNLICEAQMHDDGFKIRKAENRITTLSTRRRAVNSTLSKAPAAFINWRHRLLLWLPSNLISKLHANWLRLHLLIRLPRLKRRQKSLI